jgi:hypothetical protein
MTIERALTLAAYIVLRHGDAYAPIMDRLERELVDERLRASTRDRAARILAMVKEVKSVPAL